MEEKVKNEEEKKGRSGCFTIIIFLSCLSTFGIGIVVFDAVWIPLICGEDMSNPNPFNYHISTLIIMIVFPIICLRLLFKGSRYLSKFICSFFSNEQ